MYNHKCVDYIVALDACNDGLGAVWKNYVYNLPIPHHYLNLGIVQLEMIDILVVLHFFGSFWVGCRVLIECNNMAVVFLF